MYEQLPINRLEARTLEKREQGGEREKIEATNKINAFDSIHEQMGRCRVWREGASKPDGDDANGRGR